MGETIWLGMDVHARSITIAKYVGMAAKGEISAIPNEPKVIRRTFSKLRGEGELRVCYEAGPCGYDLYRQLQGPGVECTVIAPSLTPRKPGERIKTDRRDADKLARLYRAGELTAVTVPTADQEAARDLLRARADVRGDRTAARQRLGKFLLRHGRRYAGKSGWTQRHWVWIRAQEFTGPDHVVFQHYYDQVRHLDERLASLDAEVGKLAGTAEFKPLVDRLCCLRGISLLAAMVLLSELFDLRRFLHPRQLMAFVGLVPSERSSGGSRRQGRITKTGNGHVRRILVEAAWSYRHKPLQTSRLRRALEGQPAEVAAISRKALERLRWSVSRRC